MHPGSDSCACAPIAHMKSQRSSHAQDRDEFEPHEGTLCVRHTWSRVNVSIMGRTPCEISPKSQMLSRAGKETSLTYIAATRIAQ